jgi:methionyl-tRNA synthetase
LDSKGLIYKGSHKGWYSISDECFYTDNQIERLNSPGGALSGLNEEIVVSKETGSLVEWTEEENYKFRLSRFRDFLLARYRSDPHAIYPPQQHANVLDMLSLPLEDLSVSRPRNRLHWGIPVPNDSAHTVYVWFDALINYLTGVGYPWNTEEQRAQSCWPPDIQVVGKDIVR